MTIRPDPRWYGLLAILALLLITTLSILLGLWLGAL